MIRPRWGKVGNLCNETPRAFWSIFEVVSAHWKTRGSTQVPRMKAR